MHLLTEPHHAGAPGSTHRIRLVDPATGAPLAQVPVAPPAAVSAAVGSAAAAAPGWATTPAADRAAAVAELARRVRADADELARLTTVQMGKPLGDARGGVLAGASALELYAALAPVHRGRALHGAADAWDAMVHVPRGVAAVITPWNDPVAIVCQLVGANLAVGNPVVCKPSERTPLDALRLAELADGLFPPGVLAVVPGDAATGAALADDGRVAVVCLVGSVRAGFDVARRCAARLAHPVLELGGNDALVVDETVDPAWAAQQAALGAFANAGQICTSVERVLVHRDVAGAFTDELVQRASGLVVGDPTDPATTMGPLVDVAHRDRVHAAVAGAVAAGATARTGGAVPDRPGAWYPPTVLTDVDVDDPVWTEEVFGPVAPVVVVDSFDEALALAAEGPYGLAATVCTADPERARRAASLPVGTVKVNAAFGGAPGGAATPHGCSGTGFGYGPELLDELVATRVLHRSPAVPRR